MARETASDDRPIRSFVAIELGPPARAAVEEYLAALRSSISGVAWTRPEKLHLTLKFLGGVASPRLDSLARRLAAVASAHAAFTVTVAGVGAFPSITRPRVVWVGLHAPGLVTLAAAIEDACTAEGFAREARPFHPHITLGRVRAVRGRPPRAARPAAQGSTLGSRLVADAAREFGTSGATALVLFQSELRREGARYTPLRVMALADAAQA